MEIQSEGQWPDGGLFQEAVARIFKTMLDVVLQTFLVMDDTSVSI